MTLLPGTRTRASARSLTIAEGEEIDGLTVRLLPTRLAAIRGTVTMPTGAAGAGSLILITRAEVGLETSEFRSFGPNGMFEIPNLPPGQYVVFTRAAAYFGIERITLDGEDRPVSIAMQAARAL